MTSCSWDITFAIGSEFIVFFKDIKERPSLARWTGANHAKQVWRQDGRNLCTVLQLMPTDDFM